jgi:holliday junction DNA helicase RuvA
MIASIQGEVLDVSGDGLVIGIGGLGIKVLVPAPLRDSTRPGEQVSLQTYLVVREDSLTLFGFETQEAREFFTLLLAVNGVGPRIALAILSVLSTDAIRRAVISEQADIFARVPGVGRKTAQKILLGLQGRIKGEVGPLEVATSLTGVEAEIIDALTSLGYSIVEAQAAVQAIPKETPIDVETRLRLALQYFSK